MQRSADGASTEEELAREEEEASVGLQAKQERGGAPSVGAPGNASPGLPSASAQPLPRGLHARMEAHFGRELSGVRVHDGAEAHEAARHLGARALTAGRDIYFGAGWYRPDTASGRALLAHELAHVLQQGGTARRQASAQGSPLVLGRPGDPLEREADAAGESYSRSETSKGDARERPHITKSPGIAAPQRADAHPAQPVSAGPLPDGAVEVARAWYAARRAEYSPSVVRQLQERVGTHADGVLGAFTIQAIGAWQKANGLFVDGKAGGGTLLKMFGKDIRPSGDPSPAPTIAAQPEEGAGRVAGFLRGLLRAIGFGEGQADAAVAGRDVAPASQTAPGSSKHKLVVAENFAETLDGVSIKPSLMKKMRDMAAHVLGNDLVKEDVVFSSGMRSPSKAHRWSTAYQIRQGAVPLKNLERLEGGKDLDGNVWYQPGWTLKDAQENARKAWDGAFAAEGYEKGSERRKPNTYAGGVTCHATGRAVDATFAWNWAGSGKPQIASPEKLAEAKEEIRKKSSAVTAEKVIAAIDKYAARGSFSEVADSTVRDFGLKRPALHSRSNPEDWHYEEAKS